MPDYPIGIQPNTLDSYAVHQAYYPVLGKLALNQLEISDQLIRLSVGSNNPKVVKALEKTSATTLKAAMQLANLRLMLTRWMKAQQGLISWTDPGVADINVQAEYLQSSSENC